MYQKSKNKKKKSESENDVIRTAQMMDPSLVNPMSAPADRPPIEGFVRMPEGEVEDNTRTHTCTLTFTADANMSESDIMSLFMSLKEQGIKPTRFQWVESTPTKK